MKNMRTIIMLAVIALVALSGLYAISSGSRTDAPAVPEPYRISVSVAEVESREFQDRIRAVGTLTARETALVSPKVPGNVERVLVDIGDRVEKGQILVCLDKTSFLLARDGARAGLATAQAAVSQARAQQEHAQKEYERASKLLSEHVIPQSRFDAAESAYKTATQAMNAALEQNKLARNALQNAQDHLFDADIRSPIKGDVVVRKVEVGSTAAPGSVLLRIVDQSSLKVDISVPEKNFEIVRAHTPAKLSVDAFDRRGFSGYVTVVNPMVDPATRTFLARIDVPNTDGALIDGMFARVELLAGDKQCLAVPRCALQRLQGSGTSYVFVVKDGALRKKKVATGQMDDEFAEITGGLVPGELVVTGSTGSLRAGAIAEIIDRQNTLAGSERR